MSLTLGWFLGRAADLTNIKRGRYRDDAGVDFPINAEHPDQRTALLAALGPLGTEAALQAILAKLIAGPATDAKLETVRALLAGTLAVSAASLPLPSGAATAAAQEAMRALLAGTLKVQTPIPANIVSGQLSMAANTTVQLPAAALVNGIVVKAAATNTAAVLIGPTGVTTVVDGTGAGYPLAAGEAFSFAVANANAIYARSTAAAIIYFGGN